MMMHPAANSGCMLSSVTRSANGSASMQVVGGAVPAAGFARLDVISNPSSRLARPRDERPP